MEIQEWLRGRGGCAHTSEVYRAGFTKLAVARQVAEGSIRRLRRSWIVEPQLNAATETAVRCGGQLTCLSMARERGWWIPPDAPSDIHIAINPRSRTPETGENIRVHWRTREFARTHTVFDTVEQSLRNIAQCFEFSDSLAMWESAARAEGLPVEYLQGIPWRNRRASRVADALTGLVDSGLETILIDGLRHLRVRLRPQWIVGGRRKDLLIGEKLLVEIDGFEHHSTAADRTRDVQHDAELALRGFTTLRFTYRQLIYDRSNVIRTIEQAVARGLHLHQGARGIQAAVPERG